MKAVGYLLVAFGIMNVLGAMVPNQVFNNQISELNTANGISRFAATCIISILVIVGGNALIRRSKPKI